jgi:hypothetical protein
MGGLNKYAYVKNNPVSYGDPNGTERLSSFTHNLPSQTYPPTPTPYSEGSLPPDGGDPSSGAPVEVIIWFPTDNNINGIGGHVSYIIDGRMWSFEGGGWHKDLTVAQAYLDHNQAYRSGTGYVLDFGSPEANAAFVNSIKRGYLGRDPFIGSPIPDKYPYNLRFNNCGHAFSRALWENGYGYDSHYAPLGHQFFIETSLRGYIKEKHEYPQTGLGNGVKDSLKKAYRDLLHSWVQGVRTLYGERY